MAEQPAGSHIDATGVTFDLDGDEVVTDVLVIAKVTKLGGDAPEDRRPRMLVNRSPATDWITMTGLLHAARAVVDQAPRCESDEES